VSVSNGQFRKISGRKSPGRKLAEQIAEEVEREIMASGWPVGEQLGTEVSLADRYGVSRAVMREAVRILEHHMVASPRRGTGGGVVIRSPEMGAVVPVVRLFLDHEGVSRASLLEARSAIELSAVSLAAERITDDKRARLEVALSAEAEQLEGPRQYLHSHDLHILLAELSDNPAMTLFVSVLTQLTSEHAQSRFSKVTTRQAVEIGKDIARAHAAIVSAVVKGNAQLAQRRMLSHLEAVTSWLT
jgi:DNA-binding FadR family transcriptional regulator